MRLRRLFPALCAALSMAACSGAGAASGDLPRADYDSGTGRLNRLQFDADRNGRNDAVGVMDGTRIERIELDTNEDGVVDRWDVYDSRRRLQKVGLSRQNDGILDTYAFYADADADVLVRMEVSTRRDGRFDRVEFYETGVLARVEEDTNGDGRPDKWETYRAEPRAVSAPGAVAGSAVSVSSVSVNAVSVNAVSVSTVAFDDTFRGTPTRRLIYTTDGAVERVEVDPEGDGTFETMPRPTPTK